MTFLKSQAITSEASQLKVLLYLVQMDDEHAFSMSQNS